MRTGRSDGESLFALKENRLTMIASGIDDLGAPRHAVNLAHIRRV
jgi:hypothetical protein